MRKESNKRMDSGMRDAYSSFSESSSFQIKSSEVNQVMQLW